MTVNIEDQKEIYLDANFLVYWFINKEPDIKKRAYVLFAKLLACKCKIVVSALTFDETWLGMRKELGPKNISNRPRFFINKLFERVGIKLINHGTSEFSYTEIYDDLNSFTNNLMRKDNFDVIQSKNPASGVMKALKYLGDYNLKPRDSFHLSIIEDNGVSIFIGVIRYFFCPQRGSKK